MRTSHRHRLRRAHFPLVPSPCRSPERAWGCFVRPGLQAFPRPPSQPFPFPFAARLAPSLPISLRPSAVSRLFRCPLRSALPPVRSPRCVVRSLLPQPLPPRTCCRVAAVGCPCQRCWVSQPSRRVSLAEPISKRTRSRAKTKAFARRNEALRFIARRPSSHPPLRGRAWRGCRHPAPEAWQRSFPRLDGAGCPARRLAPFRRALRRAAAGGPPAAAIGLEFRRNSFSLFPRGRSPSSAASMFQNCEIFPILCKYRIGRVEKSERFPIFAKRIVHRVLAWITTIGYHLFLN